MAYFCEGVLICRRTGDLSVIWTQELGSDFKKQWRLALSADGSYVAATPDDSNFFAHSERSPYVVVYAGRDGKELSRIPSSGSEAIAISPNGKLLALGEVVRESGDAVLTVHIRDATSGQELTTLVLDRVKRGQTQFVTSGIRIEFTADASYVITSANNSVKAWRMENDANLCFE
jgi:hypothetical protein